MILKNLKLHPFAGTTDRKLALSTGLNTILGHNEAGKSTIVRALFALLFHPVELSPARQREFLKPFLPLQGGNTIRISAEFEFDDNNALVEKEWGGAKSAKLKMGKGGDFNGSGPVQEKLDEISDFPQSAYEHIFITNQAALQSTMDILKKSDSIFGLADKLRRAIYDLDGISVEALKQEVDCQVTAYYNNWDMLSNRPEKGRDWDNKWLKNIGCILAAYYDWKSLENECIKVKEYEINLDRENNALLDISAQTEKLGAQIKYEAPLISDAQKSRELMQKLSIITLEGKSARETLTQWPAIENELKNINERLTEQGEKMIVLEKSVSEAIQYEQGRQVLERFDKAKQSNQKLLDAQAQLSNAKEIQADDVSNAEKYQVLLDNIKIKIEAKKLRFNLLAKENINFTLKPGIANPENISMEAGQKLEQIISGRILLENSGFSLSLLAGEEDTQADEERFLKGEAMLKEILSKYNCQDVNALKLQLKEYDTLKKAVSEAEFQLKTQLGSDTLDELKAMAESLPQNIPVQSSKILQAEWQKEYKRKTEWESDKKRLEAQLDKWQKEFISQDELLNKVTEHQILWKQTKAEFDALKPIPEGYTSAEDFLHKHDSAKKSLQEYTQKQNEIEKNIIGLQSRQPDKSLEELNELTESAKTQYERQLRTGQSYLKIQQELNLILAELDRDTFIPLKIKTEEYLSRLTNGKYKSLPEHIMVAEGIMAGDNILPQNLLSQGTLDILALATRLAMADFYLQDKKGFIILDDPLVNLDPERQKSAARCLQEMAQKNQVIVLTCHPAHAELIGGALIEL